MESVCRGNSTVGSNPTLSATQLPHVSDGLRALLIASPAPFPNAIQADSREPPAGRAALRLPGMPRRGDRSVHRTTLTCDTLAPFVATHRDKREIRSGSVKTVPEGLLRAPAFDEVNR